MGRARFFLNLQPERAPEFSPLPLQDIGIATLQFWGSAARAAGGNLAGEDNVAHRGNDFSPAAVGAFHHKWAGWNWHGKLLVDGFACSLPG
jgi:hypothetical protein